MVLFILENVEIDLNKTHFSVHRILGYYMEGALGPLCSPQPRSRRPKVRLPLWYQRLVSTLRQFYMEGQLTDVSLVCKDGHQVRAHGIMLYLGSDLVRRLVRTRGEADQDQVVIMLPDFDGAVVADFVETFFYCRAVVDGVYRPNFEELRKIFELRDEGKELKSSSGDKVGTLADFEIDVDDDDSDDGDDIEDNLPVRDDDLKILQTAEGDLLLVNCNLMDDDDENDGMGETRASFLDQVNKFASECGGDGDANPCGLCDKIWGAHSVTLGGDLVDDRLTLYQCCLEECSQKSSLFRSLAALQSHVAFHYDSLDELGFDGNDNTAPCPLCYGDKEHHRNK